MICHTALGAKVSLDTYFCHTAQGAKVSSDIYYCHAAQRAKAGTVSDMLSHYSSRQDKLSYLFYVT